jgi:hypothetical protein
MSPQYLSTNEVADIIEKVNANHDRDTDFLIHLEPSMVRFQVEHIFFLLWTAAWTYLGVGWPLR